MKKSKNLGDTRNMIDNNSHLKKQNRNSSKNSFKALKSELTSDQDSSTSKKVKPLTKGQLFKQKFTFSRSVARAMRRNGIIVPKTIVGYGTDVQDALDEYRKLRNDRKKATRKIAAKKRSDSVAKRKYGKDPSKKGKSQKKDN